MSMVNVVIERDRALIGVDTVAAFMGESKSLMAAGECDDRHTCKLVLFPQISTAVTHRGDALLASVVRMQLDTACPNHFDHAAHLMPEFLLRAYAEATAYRKHHFGVESFPGSEVILVGWSPAAKRFIAVQWVRRPNDRAFVAYGVKEMLLLPEIDRVEQIETPDTAEKMAALMRRQILLTRQEFPEYADAVGGRVMFAELSRDVANVRMVADLDPPQ